MEWLPALTAATKISCLLVYHWNNTFSLCRAAFFLSALSHAGSHPLEYDSRTSCLPPEHVQVGRYSFGPPDVIPKLRADPLTTKNIVNGHMNLGTQGSTQSRYSDSAVVHSYNRFDSPTWMGQTLEMFSKKWLSIVNISLLFES